MAAIKVAFVFTTITHGKTCINTVFDRIILSFFLFFCLFENIGIYYFDNQCFKEYL